MPYFDGATGRVYYRHWEAEDPRAHVVFLHGHGEHTGHYHRFAGALNHRQISVWGMDLAGHGISAGERRVVTSVDDIAADGAALATLARRAAAGLPVVLAGHSLGGVSAAILTIRDADSYAGLVLTGTPLDGLPELDALPEMSREPFYLDALEHDPLGFENPAADATLGDALAEAAPRLADGLPLVDLPVLFINGTEDAFAPPERAAELAAHMPAARAIAHEAALHDIINDTIHRVVAGEIADFVLAIA